MLRHQRHGPVKFKVDILPFFTSVKLFVLIIITILSIYHKDVSAELIKSHHTSNWAVIVSASRYWFNYRHNANALSIYHTIKQQGIPDTNIILMLAEDIACDPRNIIPGTVYNSPSHRVNLYRDDDVSVDYRGLEVTVENLLRVLTGRHAPDTPRSKRLLTDENSNVLIFLTGHGGDEFLKFQDDEILSAQDLAESLEQMHQQRRYNKVLLMLDTCQASTMTSRLQSPNILAIGSSGKGESSYSHSVDYQLGNTVIDRFTYYTLEFFEAQRRLETHYLEQQLKHRQQLDAYSNGQLVEHPNTSFAWQSHSLRKRLSEQSLNDMFTRYSPSILGAHAVPRTDLLESPLTPSNMRVSDFFAATTAPVVQVGSSYPFTFKIPASSAILENRAGGCFQDDYFPYSGQKSGVKSKVYLKYRRSPTFTQNNFVNAYGIMLALAICLFSFSWLMPKS